MKSSIALLFLCLGISINLKAQSGDYKPKDLVLFDAIAHMDSVMFNAFNNQDMNVLKSIFAENVEFYNNGGGVSDYNTTMENFEAMFDRNRTSSLTRTLVPGTMEVYPIPRFGAIETGTHLFTHKENGKTEVATMKFVQIWQYRDNQWKATRVISIGH